MADIVTTKQFVNGQLGVDGDDLNEIVGQAVIQTGFVSGKPVANSPGDNDSLLLLQSAGTYAQLLYKNLFNPKWVRTAAGIPQYVSTINGDMSIWQRGVTFNPVVGAEYTADRWRVNQNFVGSAAVAEVTQIDLAGSLPGSANNPRPRYGLRVSCTTIGTIGAGNFFGITQRIELSQARKLFDQPSSLSLWVRTNNAGTYTVVVANADNSQTYKQDFVVGSPNVWTQLTLPAIPAMPTGTGNWGTNESDFSYSVGIYLAAGATFQSSIQSAWLAGQKLGSASTSNLFTSNTNTFDITMVQHESGSLPTPFSPDRGGLTETRLKCSRYYWNTYPSGTAPGNAGVQAGQIWWISTAGGGVMVGPAVRPPVEMRPGVTANIYDPGNGVLGTVISLAGAHLGGGTGVPGDLNPMGFDQINFTGTPLSANTLYGFHAELIAEL